MQLLSQSMQTFNVNSPKIENSKSSKQSMGIIQSYAANTHQGLVRNYNEDRVSIILNVVKS